jgi:hypothetical protein
MERFGIRCRGTAFDGVFQFVDREVGNRNDLKSLLQGGHPQTNGANAARVAAKKIKLLNRGCQSIGSGLHPGHSHGTTAGEELAPYQRRCLYSLCKYRL